MYHTPTGDRVLLGAERRFFTCALSEIVEFLSDEDQEFGVALFDQLQRNQKLVVLCEAAHALLDPDRPMPELTAVLEAAVATVFTYANDQLIVETDDPELAATTWFWRRLVLEAALETDAHDDLPDVTSTDENEWTLLLECQVDRVLWDNDYESQIGLDLPPEQNSRLLAVLGIADDYFTAVPPDPPDDQVRRYVDALVDLSADESQQY